MSTAPNESLTRPRADFISKAPTIFRHPESVLDQEICISDLACYISFVMAAERKIE